MAEAQETFAQKWEKFHDSFERYLEERTDDDRCNFNERVKRIPELYKLLRENSGGTISDDNSKRNNEVSEGVSESKIMEVVALDNKILNNDNCEIKMGVNGKETDQLNKKDDQVTENEVSKNSINGNNKITDNNGYNTESVGANENRNKEVTVNKVSENKGNITDNEASLNVNQVIVYKVSNRENNSDNCNNDSEIMLNINNKEVFENRVSKSDTGNKSRMRVEVNQGLLVSVNDLEREYRDRLSVEGEQGASLYRVKCETEISQVVYGDKRSSLGHLSDNGSANSQTSFLCLSGVEPDGV